MKMTLRKRGKFQHATLIIAVSFAKGGSHPNVSISVSTRNEVNDMLKMKSAENKPSERLQSPLDLNENFLDITKLYAIEQAIAMTFDPTTLPVSHSRN